MDIGGHEAGRLGLGERAKPALQIDMKTTSGHPEVGTNLVGEGLIGRVSIDVAGRVRLRRGDKVAIAVCLFAQW